MTAQDEEEILAVTEWFPATVRTACLITFGYPRHAKRPLLGVCRGLLVVDGHARRYLVDTSDGVTRFVERQHFHPSVAAIYPRVAA